MDGKLTQSLAHALLNDYPSPQRKVLACRVSESQRLGQMLGTSDCVHMLTNSSQELSQPIPRYIGRAFSSVYQIALNVNLDSSQAAGTFLSQRSGSEGVTFVVWSILFPLCLALHTLQSPLTCKRH